MQPKNRRRLVLASVAGIALGYAALLGEAVKMHSKGYPVSPLAMEDFNHDGIRDIIYRSNPLPVLGYRALVFVDGNYVSTDPDGTCRRHSIGAPVLAVDVNTGFDFNTGDFDGDGNLDFEVAYKKQPADGQPITQILLGDGKGRFKCAGNAPTK